jgi:hypothetical protein
VSSSCNILAVRWESRYLYRKISSAVNGDRLLLYSLKSAVLNTQTNIFLSSYPYCAKLARKWYTSSWATSEIRVILDGSQQQLDSANIYWIVWRSWDRTSWYISIVKTTRCTIFEFIEYHYMFRTVFPSIVRSSRLYTQHHVYVIQVSWPLASEHEMERSSISCSLASIY